MCPTSDMTGVMSALKLYFTFVSGNLPSVSQYKYNRKKTKNNKKLGLDFSWDMVSLRVLSCSCRTLNPVLPIIALKNSPDGLIMPATLPLKHICHLRKNLQYKNHWKNIHPFPTPYYIFVGLLWLG